MTANRTDRSGAPPHGPTWTQVLSTQAGTKLACDFLTADTVLLNRIGEASKLTVSVMLKAER